MQKVGKEGGPGKELLRKENGPDDPYCIDIIHTSDSDESKEGKRKDKGNRKLCVIKSAAVVQQHQFLTTTTTNKFCDKDPAFWHNSRQCAVKQLT